jgi:hypothetical protein
MGVRLLAVVASLLLVSLLVITNSRAAFTGTTDPATGSWDTAGVTITQDAPGNVLFETEEMVPGDVVKKNTTVTYTGSADSVNVRLYGEKFTDSDNDLLAANLNLIIGTSDGAADVYDGTLAGFAAHTDFGNGADTWNTVAPGATRTYFFEVELDSGAPQTVQSKTASIEFVWEAQSNPTQGQS